MRAWTSVLVLALAIGVPATGTIAAAEDRGIEKAKEALEPLLAEFEAARDAMYERMRGLRETEAYQEAYEKRDFETIRGMQDEISKPFMAEWAETFTKKAKPYQGHEAELIFNAAMLQNQLADEPAQLAKSMIETHPKSALIGPIVDVMGRMSRMMDKDEFRGLLQRIIDENPSAEIQAQAYFSRATAVRYDRDASDDDKASMHADFERVVALLPEEHILSMRARGPKFEEERLQIGMEAPDIVGEDLFGEAFKLSDYRGKVIMLDFWGDW